MGTKLINSVTQSLITHLIFTYLCISATQELHKGFTISPDPSVHHFQLLLNESTGNYSLGLLRVNSDQLALSIVHIPSTEPIWTANPTRPAKWAVSTRVSFNGSLVISDPRSGVIWSTLTDGDRVWLSNSSNLQIQASNSNDVLWQSFDYPTDTLVENQNFTSTMALVSSNGLYSMRLGDNFMGLYAKFGSEPGSGQIYLKHKALEAKAPIIEGQGPIYLVLNPDGFLGMYQNGSVPVDVDAFNTFNNPETRGGIRRVRVEPDGNFRGYYWTGSSWVMDYQAITDTCQLPSACGPYGLCNPGIGCGCIDNKTEFKSGQCGSGRIDSGDFCGLGNLKYKVLRRSGLSLPYKELMGYKLMGSRAQCEDTCEKDCTCWGAVYNNASGFCYTIEYPIQSMVNEGDEGKMGYFKVRERAGEKRWAARLGVGFGLLCGAVLGIGAFVGIFLYKMRNRRGVSGSVEEEGGVGVGPYKDLASASFRSLELVGKR